MARRCEGHRACAERPPDDAATRRSSSAAACDCAGSRAHDRLDRRIEHRVYQIGIRFAPDCPADDEAVEAVDDGRKINFTRSDVEFGDVGQPFLIRSGSLEVSIDDILRRRTNLAEV